VDKNAYEDAVLAGLRAFRDSHSKGTVVNLLLSIDRRESAADAGETVRSIAQTALR